MAKNSFQQIYEQQLGTLGFDQALPIEERNKISKQASEAASKIFNSDVASTIKGTSASSPVQSTQQIAQERDQNRVDAANIGQDITMAQNTLYDSVLNFDPMKDPAIVEANKALTDLTARISGGLSASDEARIEQAGQMAGAEFEPLISDAKESKRQGMPRATIGAGERGGFMNTQYAGAAAVAPTEGGAFAGAGGELENIKSAYDRNIDTLKAKQLQAINMAKAAERQAIMTGKQQDLDNLIKLRDQAVQMSQMVQNANMQKIQAIENYEKSRQARTIFEQGQEDREIGNIAGQLYYATEGASQDEIASLVTAEAAARGIDPNRLSTAINEFAASDLTRNLDLATKSYNIAKNIPAGETFVDPQTGIIIQGTKENEPEYMDIVKTVGSTEYKVRYDLSDPSNPKELFSIELGPRWKGGGSASTPENETDIREAIIQTATLLDGLKDTGEFNDFYYGQALTALANEYKITDPVLAGELQSTVNTYMENLRPSNNTNNQSKNIGSINTNNKSGNERLADFNQNVG